MSETVGQSDRAWRDKDRRRVHRRLARQGKSIRQIAEKTGASKSTVGRDITDLEPEPIAVTPGGAKVYKLGRYNDDPDYQEMMREASRDMPKANARRWAAREMNATGYRIGDIFKGGFGSDKPIRTPEEKAAAWKRLGFDEAA